MGFLDIFKKDKKKGDKKEKSKNDDKNFKRYRDGDPSSNDPRNRRSVHFGDQSLFNLQTACYQSIGRKYPKGARSCPGEELNDYSSGPTDRERYRNSSNHPASSDRAPRKESSRYSTFIDASSEDEENIDQQRSKDPSSSEDDKVKEVYREAYIKEKSEREQERRRNDEMMNRLQQKVRDLEINNGVLRAEQDMMRRNLSMQYEAAQQLMSPYYAHTGLMAPRTSTPSSGPHFIDPQYQFPSSPLPTYPAPASLQYPPSGQFRAPADLPHTPLGQFHNSGQFATPPSRSRPSPGHFPAYVTPSRADAMRLRANGNPRQLIYEGAGESPADNTYSRNGSPYSHTGAQYGSPSSTLPRGDGRGARVPRERQEDNGHYEEM